VSQAPVAARDQPVGIRLDGYSLRTPTRSLLEQARAEIPAGSITLLVGPSGVGKSLLLQSLARLPSVRNSSVEGTGSWCFTDPTGAPRLDRRPPTIGFVFQSLALFDDWSPSDNVQFGLDHRVGGTARRSADDWLKELRVPAGVPTARLSGGQRQRLAIARVLAQSPAIIFFDEPTSGLDEVTARQVAELIAQAHRRHQTTCVVVTHDVRPFLSAADQVLLFDGATQSLRPIEPRPDRDWGEVLSAAMPAAPVERPPRANTPWGWLAWGLERTTLVALELLTLPVRLLPVGRSPRWFLRSAGHACSLVAGWSAWIYLALAGLIVGWVATYFTFKYMPYARYTETLFVENLLASIGFALYRILVPIFATILIAARSGAAIAADVGGRVYGRQQDALSTMGIDPDAYARPATLWGMILTTPLLVGWASLLSALASLVVFTAIRPEWGPTFWERYFFEAFWPVGQTYPLAWGWWLSKVVLCGWGSSQIAYGIGSLPKRSSEEVSRSITRTVLLATLWVLVVHFAYAFVEFE
jgi:ABC-type lipoprotein export system ATPase subunit/ABC-type transporter Mla maintaining outer membrane lipid asymmetry permease subunit MlaE